jgi:hypothetical protein
MRKVIIINNKRKHVVHLISRHKKAEARLAPGLNQVALDTWKALLTEQSVQDRLEDGWFEEDELKQEDVDVSYYLNENAARARTIARSHDLTKEVMQEWHDKETRKGIKDILKKRLTEKPDKKD